jgi:hypothetical protein
MPPPPTCDANCQGITRVNICVADTARVCAGSCGPDFNLTHCNFCREEYHRCCQAAYLSWDAFCACWGGCA